VDKGSSSGATQDASRRRLPRSATHARHAGRVAFPDLRARVELHPGSRRARVAAVGDVALGPAVAEQVLTRGAEHPFASVAPLFARSDLVIGNLEYPLTRTQARHPLVRHRHRQAPPEAAAWLARAGFGALGIANNHMLDCLAEGLADTVQALREVGIRCMGAGSSLAAARAPALVDVAGLRFGLLAYTYPLHQIATPTTPGCAPNRSELMLADVRELRERCDHVIVSIHAGREFRFYPSLQTQIASRSLVDAGARAVLYHHAHVPLGVEVHAGGVIAYGLGNFLCNIHDDYFRSVASPHLHEGLVLELDFDAERLLGFELHPTEITPELAVRPLAGEAALRVKSWLCELSRPLVDPAELAALEEDRGGLAKLRRLVAKGLAHGLHALAAELCTDVASALRSRRERRSRERALAQALSAFRTPIEPNGLAQEAP
jgi:poly-gamma-glutamate synthesis protein (capsule biosynthesis protein)